MRSPSKAEILWFCGVCIVSVIVLVAWTARWKTIPLGSGAFIRINRYTDRTETLQYGRDEGWHVVDFGLETSTRKPARVQR